MFHDWGSPFEAKSVQYTTSSMGQICKRHVHSSLSLEISFNMTVWVRSISKSKSSDAVVISKIKSYFCCLISASLVEKSAISIRLLVDMGQNSNVMTKIFTMFSPTKVPCFAKLKSVRPRVKLKKPFP